MLTDIAVVIGASAGLLVARGSLPSGALTQLLQEVDCALYAAKRAGDGHCSWAQADAALRRAS